MTVTEVDQQDADWLQHHATPPLLAHWCTDGAFKLYRHTLAIGRAFAECALTPNGRLIVSIPPQRGKRVPCDTPVLTPRGWIEHGALRPGDEVYGRDGRPTRVVGVSERAWTPTRRLRFTDGTDQLAHPEHLWTVHDRKKGTVDGGPLVTLSTDDIAAHLRLGPEGRGGRYRYLLPFTEPIATPSTALPVDSYWLGVWLGDGKTTDPRLDLCPTDAVEIDDHCEPVPSSQGVHPDTGVPWFGFRLTAELRTLGVLGDKHIPDRYLVAGEPARRALLAGLVDTDGTVDCRHNLGTVIYTSRSERLANDVATLARSLGYHVRRGVVDDTRPPHEIVNRAGKHHMIATAGRDYVVKWTPHDGMGQGWLERKQHPTKGTRRRVGIAAVEPSVDQWTNCIKVAATDGMYLVGRHLTPTHNTSTCSVWGPIWYLDKNPHHEVLVASYGDELRQRIGREMRTAIKRHPNRLRLRLSTDSQAAHRFDTPEGGGLFATTVRSELSGFPGHLIVVDDPYRDWMQAHSPRVRKEVSDWFKTVALMRSQAETSIVLCTTRYHLEDLSGELEADTETEFPWTVLRIPAVADDDPDHPDALGRAPGEVIEERQHPAPLVREAIRTLGAYRASSIMLQRPAPLEGGLLKKANWVYAPPPLDAQLRRVCRSWDLAYSESDGSDWTVGTLMATWRQLTYVLEMIRVQVEPTALRQLLKDTARDDSHRWGRKVTQLFEQEPAGGKMLAETIADDWLAGYKTHVDKPVIKKELRATNMAAAQGNREIVLCPARRPDGSFVDQDWSELVEEAAVFPAQGANDDIVDTLAHGYDWLAEAAPVPTKVRSAAGRRTMPGR